MHDYGLFIPSLLRVQRKKKYWEKKEKKIDNHSIDLHSSVYLFAGRALLGALRSLPAFPSVSLLLQQLLPTAFPLQTPRGQVNASPPAAGLHPTQQKMQSTGIGTGRALQEILPVGQRAVQQGRSCRESQTVLQMLRRRKTLLERERR